MKVKVLREALARLSGDVESEDLEALGNALKHLDELSLKELGDAIEKIKLPKRSPAPVDSQAAIARYLAELEAARNDSATFNSILDRVKLDRTFKVSDANILAQSFLGNEVVYKSKPPALKAIGKRQFSIEKSQARKDKVGGIF